MCSAEPAKSAAEPLPTLLSAIVYVLIAKAAVTVRLDDIASEIGLVVVVVSPLHPVKCQPFAGTAVSDTTVPGAYAD